MHPASPEAAGDGRTCLSGQSRQRAAHCRRSDLAGPVQTPKIQVICQAVEGTAPFALRYPTKPRPAKPRSIVTQVAGSGTEGPTPVMPGLKMKVPPVFVVKVGSTMPLNWSPLGAGSMVTHVWTK